jgi:archaellum component FlaC
MEDK